MRAGDNPFSVQKLGSLRYRLSGQTWDDLLERLAALDWRAAIVGPHGHGKTTLLKNLVPHLEARGFRVRSVLLHTGDRHLRRERKERLFRDMGPRDILCVDGAEQLGRWSWLALRLRARAAGGLLITSHRPGLLPTLVDCETTPELLKGIVRDLLGAVGDEERMGSEQPDLDALFARHGGNVREALWELYDVWGRR